MPDLGQLLRDTMVAHQDDAPVIDGLLTAARQRRRARQTLLTAGAATIAVAATVAGAVTLSPTGPQRRPAQTEVMIPPLDGQGSLDDRLFQVQAPQQSAIIGGLGAQPLAPCDLTHIDARGELRRVFDGSVGVVVLEATKRCSIFVNGTTSLIDAQGQPLDVPYSNPDPTTAEVGKHALQADFNAGEGRIGFAWRGSWCGKTAAALQLPLSRTPRLNPSPGPTLTVPLTGPSPACDKSSDAVFVPGTVHGVSWPTVPMDSGVLPGQPSWSKLTAKVAVENLELKKVRLSVTLHNTSDEEIVLQPCPRFSVAIYYGYSDGSFEPEHDALFPCETDPVIPPRGERSYTLPGLDFSADTDQRTATRRVLSFAFSGLQPVRLNIPAR
jgi:hypothetical protein